MEPSEITRLIENSKVAITRSNTSPDGFLLAYVAWEAFQVRVLIVGLAARGMSVSEAKLYLQREQIWKQHKKDSVFKEVFGAYPCNLKYVGKRFTEANNSSELRNRYIHGTSRTSPKNFADLASKLIEIMEQDWSKDLASLLATKGVTTKYTNPMRRVMRS
jgi:hypothetical protein